MKEENKLEQAVMNSFTYSESSCNVATALYYIGDSLQEVAKAIQALGVGNASTDMGAVEFLAVSIKEGLSGVHSHLENISDAIRNK